MLTCLHVYIVFVRTTYDKERIEKIETLQNKRNDLTNKLVKNYIKHIKRRKE